MKFFSRPSRFLPAAGNGFRLAILVMACLLLSSPALAISADPLSAIVEAQRGIDESDADLFNRAVDLTSVLNKAAGALNTALRDQFAAGRIGGGTGAMVMLLTSAEGDSAQAGIVKQLMISEVHSFVVAGINGGYFAGKPNDRIKPEHGTLAAALPKMPKGRRELAPGKVLSRQDDNATVSAMFTDPEAGRFPLTLALERQNGNWRVVEILNAAELLDEATARGR